LSKGRNFVRHCCRNRQHCCRKGNNVEATFDIVERTKFYNRIVRLWQQSRMLLRQSRTLLWQCCLLLRHCCWCGRGLTKPSFNYNNPLQIHRRSCTCTLNDDGDISFTRLLRNLDGNRELSYTKLREFRPTLNELNSNDRIRRSLSDPVVTCRFKYFYTSSLIVPSTCNATVVTSRSLYVDYGKFISIWCQIFSRIHTPAVIKIN